MGWESMLFILLATLGLMLVLGQWTAFALGFVGTLILYIARGTGGFISISSVVWNTANNYILIAVPLFLLMGEVILRSGVSERFYRGVATLLVWAPGGLLHANVVATAIFSAISGSSVATAASVGTVAIPELRARGYDNKIVFGSLAAGGTLGILIPPSIVMILYGALVEESIPKLFMAGLFPGIAMAALFSVYIGLRVMANRALAPRVEEQHLSLKTRLAYTAHILPVLALMVVVLGGIYWGVTTPTEAAAIGALGAIALSVGYRTFNLRLFGDALLSSVRTTCMVLFIILSAQILSTALAYAGITREMSQWIVDMQFSKWALFLAMVVLYIILGFFVDGISMIYITLPVLFPVVVAAGFDVIWFGVVLTILIELGQITPPVGLNLFTIQGISGGRPFGEVVLGSTPFVFLMLIIIALLVFFPGLALWLPSLM
ncbi:MAG: TRAP transporter large permease [Candidatus Lambdaproteobacteria bacterium]|nr:TRAP transporter large permease [Candidatus Lambdaproteobacteria bacterium]